MAFRRSASAVAAQLSRRQDNVVGLGSSINQVFAAEVAGPCQPLGVRCASQLAVKQRMRSVTNIQKITKAMKMVAASKMRVAQVSTLQSRGIVQPFLKLLGDLPDTDVEKNLTVAISTDKGLCGGINSTVSKYSRGSLAVTSGDGKKAELVIFGEKAKAQLQRDQKEKIIGTFADLGKNRITFPQVSHVADELLKTDFDAARIIYNRFGSAISFKPTIATILSPDALEKSVETGGKLDTYEIEGPDRPELLQDIAEFNLALTLYNAVLENNCSEQASRMSAMENSTKNASEMLEKLTLYYNRSRQAKITTELIEIISGASALEAAK